MTQKEEETKKTTQKMSARKGLKPIDDIEKLPEAVFDTTVTNEKIEKIMEKYKDGTIEYPEIQRNSVWSMADQAELIESLIRGIPIPPLYANKYYKDGVQKWEILDGRQRITALADFFVDSLLEINGNLPKGYENLQGYTFKDIQNINPRLEGKFISLTVPIAWMDDAKPSLKKEFFQKLNKGGKSLSTGELAHSSLNPSKEYIASLLDVPFYKTHMKATKRYAEYVPPMKVVHFILKSLQLDEGVFEYNPDVVDGWKERIVTNERNILTDLDNLHLETRDNQKIKSLLTPEIERVSGLINEIFGELHIKCPTNKLLTNMMLSLLILEDKGNSQCISHDELKQAYTDLVEVWDKGHAPLIRQKMKSQLSNITRDEAKLINECDTIESLSKNSFNIMLENLKHKSYSYL